MIIVHLINSNFFFKKNNEFSSHKIETRKEGTNFHIGDKTDELPASVLVNRKKSINPQNDPPY